MPWDKSPAVKMAERFVLSFQVWLRRQHHRDDAVGKLSHWSYDRRAPDYRERRDAQLAAEAEYQRTAAERVEAMTRPLPPEFVALCQAVYAAPGDLGPLTELGDWLTSNLGPTPVERNRNPIWLKGRSRWTPLGFSFDPYSSWPCFGVSHEKPIHYDHCGRTMMYGREVFVSEPYATISDALGMAAWAAPLADAIVFATGPGDHHPRTVRIGIIHPDGIIPDEMRRQAVVANGRRSPSAA